MKSNVTLVGEGQNSTIIEKNCNDYGISSIGGSGTEITDVAVRNLGVTRNAADTNSKALVYFEYTDDSVISHVLCSDSYDQGIQVVNGDRNIIEGCIVNGWHTSGAISCGGLAGSADSVIRDCVVDNSSTSKSTAIYGIGGLATAGSIIGCTVRNIAGDHEVWGIAVNGVNMKISSSHVENLDCSDVTSTYSAVGIKMAAIEGKTIGNTVIDVDHGGSAAGAAGIQVSGDRCTIADNQVRDGNDEGIEIVGAADRTNVTGNTSLNNTTANYTDGGTNTTATGNIIA